MDKKVRINLRDKNFAGEPSSCHKGVNKYVEWVRDNELVSKSCFYTDMCLQDVDKNNASKRHIAWLNEPRAIHGQWYDWIAENNRKFDYVLTFDKQLLDRGENFLFYPHGRCWIKDFNVKKSKLCSTIASAKNWTVGHKLRHEAINRYPGKFDVYGRQYKPVENKEEALSDYYFSITIENSIADYYWTEKVVDCFATRTIPIYYGTKSIVEHFNPDGIIFFETLEELEKILNEMSPELYNKMAPAVEENFELSKKFFIPEDWMFENLNFLFD